jgi:hypothetical protein
VQRSLLVVAACLAVLAGCGNSTKTVSRTGANGQVTTRTVPNVHFAKTKFVLHTGLAFGAFHRYMYKPLRAHQFSKGAPGRTKAFVKAGLAGLFAAHELKLANRAALSDDRLRPLAQRIDGLSTRLKALATSLKAGTLNTAAITGTSGVVDAITGQSRNAGAIIKDIASPAIGG